MFTPTPVCEEGLFHNNATGCYGIAFSQKCVIWITWPLGIFHVNAPECYNLFIIRQLRVGDLGDRFWSYHSAATYPDFHLRKLWNGFSHIWIIELLGLRATVFDLVKRQPYIPTSICENWTFSHICDWKSWAEMGDRKKWSILATNTTQSWQKLPHIDRYQLFYILGLSVCVFVCLFLNSMWNECLDSVNTTAEPMHLNGTHGLSTLIVHLPLK